jgi:hypothetical protein
MECGRGAGGWSGRGGLPRSNCSVPVLRRNIQHSSRPTHLCLPRLLLKLNPDTVPTFNRNPTHISKKMENVTIFLRGCRTLGLADFELFSTADLVEEKNVMSVANTIHALGRLMQSSKYAHMNFPTLGKKAAEKNVRRMRGRSAAAPPRASGGGPPLPSLTPLAPPPPAPLWTPGESFYCGAAQSVASCGVVGARLFEL